MKRPRPVRSEESSTRAIDWPTQVEPDSGWAATEVEASAIPNVSPAQVTASGRAIQRWSGPAISGDLETYHPVSFQEKCAVQHQMMVDFDLVMSAPREALFSLNGRPRRRSQNRVAAS